MALATENESGGAMEPSFRGKTAVVTGAASGIGYTVAQHFAERGAAWSVSI
jgi:NAD(P)-dependent dehydrogenase (short-subunit alcohol dehydrogenase family)